MPSNNLEEIIPVLEKYHHEPTQLISILKEIQDIFGCLSPEVQTFISNKMNIPISEINGITTFYKLFHTEPIGKIEIKVCLGTACYVQGSKNILEKLHQELDLGDKDTTKDGLFTLKSTRCVGACALSPIITINNKVHGKVELKELKTIIRQAKKEVDEKDNDKKQKRFTENQREIFANP